MSTSDKNKANHSEADKTVLPAEHPDNEQHLEFSGAGKDNTEASDPVNQPEHHITKEEFQQRESGQAGTSAIPPPDDAPRDL